MIGIAALVVSALFAAIPHLLLGSRIDVMTDFLLGTVVGGVAYVATFYLLKKLERGW